MSMRHAASKWQFGCLHPTRGSFNLFSELLVELKRTWLRIISRDSHVEGLLLDVSWAEWHAVQTCRVGIHIVSQKLPASRNGEVLQCLAMFSKWSTVSAQKVVSRSGEAATRSASYEILQEILINSILYC
jgi:hypothetical protein